MNYKPGDQECQVSLISSSSRKRSNARELAETLLQDIEFLELNLQNLHIRDFEDHRDDRKWPGLHDDDFNYALEIIEQSKIIVFAVPIYWYGIPAKLSNFIELWSEVLATDHGFKKKMEHKKIILVLVGGDSPKVKGLCIVRQFRYIADFSNLDFLYYLIGTGNHEMDILQDKVAINKATEINQRLKRLLNWREIE